MTKGNIALWDLRDKWNMRELRKIWTKWRNEQEQKNVTYAGMRGNGYEEKFREGGRWRQLKRRKSQQLREGSNNELPPFIFFFR